MKWSLTTYYKLVEDPTTKAIYSTLTQLSLFIDATIINLIANHTLTTIAKAEIC